MKSYPIDSLFIVMVDGIKKIVYKDVSNRYYDLDSNEINDFKFIDYFEEILKENELDLLITDISGNPKKNYTKEEINFLFKILERKASLSQQNLQRKQIISVNVANIISDLLGLNIKISSNTPFKFDDLLGVDEVLVPARKLKLFKMNMIKYLRASLIDEEKLSIKYDDVEKDYRVTRSLNKAGIKETERLSKHTFSVTLSNGKLRINDVDIQKYQKDQGFQKTIKF